MCTELCETNFRNYVKMISICIFFITLLTTIFIIGNEDCFAISEVYFYSLITIGLLDYYRNKSLTYFQIWQVAFVFIILSEALLLERVDLGLLKALKYLIIANNLLILGYLSKIKSHAFIISYSDSS